jgi:pimeloyl-ACP methyl ester carboxylesterase
MPDRARHGLVSAVDQLAALVRESGHFGHIEQPDEFTAAVLVFAHNQEMGIRA